MTLVALTAFALLFGYLAAMGIKYGIPDMVSDTFYQLPPRYNGIFTMVLVEVAALMMMAILDTGAGIQCLAFIGCAALAFVGCAPNYIDKDEYKIHKSAATTAALACCGWCISSIAWPTIAIASLYGLYYLYMASLNLSQPEEEQENWHPWYWAEVCCFADVFVTYALI
jgi:hypothetical protein